MKRSLCGAVCSALPLIVVPIASAGWVIDFEDAVDRGLGDDALLSRFTGFELGGCRIQIGWDTNHDLEFDQDMRVEDYNDGAAETAGVLGYALASYSTQFTGQASSWDMDYNGNGGDYFLRANKENGFNRTTGRVLIAMHGSVWEFGAQLNDLDHGEKYTVVAYAADGTVLGTQSSPVYTGVGPTTQNGRSWSFNFAFNDAEEISFVSIEMEDDGTGGGFGLDNITFVPAPGAMALFATAGLLARNGRRRR